MRSPQSGVCLNDKTKTSIPAPILTRGFCIVGIYSFRVIKLLSKQADKLEKALYLLIFRSASPHSHSTALNNFCLRNMFRTASGFFDYSVYPYYPPCSPRCYQFVIGVDNILRRNYYTLNRRLFQGFAHVNSDPNTPYVQKFAALTNLSTYSD